MAVWLTAEERYGSLWHQKIYLFRTVVPDRDLSNHNLSTTDFSPAIKWVITRLPLHEDHLVGSMEKSLATPEQSQSSVFMTPSSSVSKPLYQAPRPLVLTPLPLSLLSPAATPKGQCMDLPPSPPENLDILSELYMRGLPHVSQQILAYLAPPDLCRWVDQLSEQPFLAGSVVL